MRGSRHAQVVSPLLHERDMYLAWSLKRSKAVNGSRAVVGVVGKGHLRGVLYHLITPDSSGLRFRDLVGDKVSRVLDSTRSYIPSLAWAVNVWWRVMTKL